MRRRYKIFLIAVVALLLFIGYKRYFFTFDQLGEGTHSKGPIASPGWKYTADSYYKHYGGATGGARVWVKITDLESGEEQTIYYADGKSNPSLNWQDDQTIFIKNDAGPEFPESDRSIELRIGKDIYDETGRACRSWIMKDQYETCYQHE